MNIEELGIINQMKKRKIRLEKMHETDTMQ